MEHLQSFIKDCDRKIQIAKKRLEETQDDHDLVPEVCFLVSHDQCSFTVNYMKLYLINSAPFSDCVTAVVMFMSSDEHENKSFSMQCF